MAEDKDPDEVVDENLAHKISQAIETMLGARFPGANSATVRAALAERARDEGLIVTDPEEEENGD